MAEKQPRKKHGSNECWATCGQTLFLAELPVLFQTKRFFAKPLFDVAVVLHGNAFGKPLFLMWKQQV